MGRVKEFFRKPKHLYFSVILMFVVVVGLASVSFSLSDITKPSDIASVKDDNLSGATIDSTELIAARIRDIIIRR